MRTMTSIFALSLAALVSAPAEGVDGERFKELTKQVDPFDRLDNVPAKIRPTAAVNTCLSYMESLVARAAKNLEKAKPDQLSEKERWHLIVSLEAVVKAWKVLGALRAEFHPQIESETELKIGQIGKVLAPFQDGAPSDWSVPMMREAIVQLSPILSALFPKG